MNTEKLEADVEELRKSQTALHSEVELLGELVAMIFKVDVDKFGETFATGKESHRTGADPPEEGSPYRIAFDLGLARAIKEGPREAP